MDSPHPVPSSPPPGFASALDQLWTRFLPEIEERLAVLDSAAAATGTGNLTPQQQQAALAAAHKLAGVLGSFGIGEGTAPARETERLYSRSEAPPRECAGQLASLAATLRSLVEDRKRLHPPAK